MDPTLHSMTISVQVLQMFLLKTRVILTLQNRFVEETLYFDEACMFFVTAVVPDRQI